MDNVWARPRKDPKPRLTLDRIVAEAVALLDEEGVGRLTMRRLADRLGTGSTTLYWHVKTKEDVLDLALDAVFGEVPLPGLDTAFGEVPISAPGDDWRAAARDLMGGWRAALLRHPWSATILDRPLMGPNALDRTEFLYRTLTAAGLDGPRAAYSLSNYVMGSVIMQVTWQERDRADTGAFLRERAGRYPALAEHGLGHDWDATFATGLGYLLRGMEHETGRLG
ncbi:MAG: TetR/AcrR family transcriptional regulator [Nonomuraea sp.]|nr:TetR/AcrR family transcriptional regulator [Nonomuraea sp.]NUP61519.1 TetR/AcrR family transcriptional regulator [Nonomuraea sp.]NUP78843.1 TetR/AcrR family transcriptional regulator [Nonomuraea sp.]NUS08434.1 TetR/AcrR family transcriptional regulator [Nonomuraea sp.]NUT11770.1 TetR/AcrR family transcriptional regulator [Nonomuraea sp.]